jgi:hypothetical protein
MDNNRQQMVAWLVVNATRVQASFHNILVFAATRQRHKLDLPITDKLYIQCFHVYNKVAEPICEQIRFCGE